jgi:dienelactone hydrolase
MTLPRRLAPALALATLALAACARTVKLSRDDSPTVLSRQLLNAPNPSLPGAFPVKRLYYGSGTDKQRPHFRDSVTIKTKTVDASAFVTIQPTQAADRKKFWGFDQKKFPINGTAWYPDGPGPFPLVLIVHGNHNYREFSDPGYAYLGELLASRGYITVSVDMNFINGLSGENDGRGWLLLKHLEAWRGFDTLPENPLRGKIDMHNIALIGHSRGGEAVGHAAAFNRLKYYPDDAKTKLGFDFDIKSLIAIAPVDGQYKPADQFVPIENVNYLVFHGSHDGDVTTFNGLRQYQRLRFTDDKPWFKAAVYVYRANHGQWNTVWGNGDRGKRSGRSLALSALLDPEAQRDFAKIYVSAFLDATLKGKREYLPIFRDHRVIGQWLPKTMYLTRFEENGFRAFSTHEGDIDVTTGSVPGVTLRGDSLAVWREGVIPFRTANSPQNNSAVWLGWNNRIAGPDTTKMGTPAAYTITLPDTLASSWSVRRDGSISFLMAPTDAKPGPRSAPKDSTARDSTKSDSAKSKAKAPPKPKTPKPPKPAPDTIPIDLTVELTDAAGATARLPLSTFGAIRRPLETRIMRREKRDKSQFSTLYELVLQTYVLPFEDFIAANPSLDPTHLRSIRFVFDRTTAGTVVLDDVGFSPLGRVTGQISAGAQRP